MGWPPRTWVLADDRPGNVNQALGVAEALGWPFTIKTIRYGRLARLPNAILGGSLRGLTADTRDALAPPWPALVIAAGRRTAPVARWLKRRAPGVFLVQLMWPGAARDLDLIAVPGHDRVPAGPAIVRTVGAPHRITPARLAAAAAELEPKLHDLPRPRIACLVGGDRRAMPFTAKDATTLARHANTLAQTHGGSLLITTSRRTGRAAADALARGIDVPHLLHRWSPAGDNPYLGLLGVAQAIIVSADSASLCTEACATGRPVFLFRPAAGVAAKLARLHAELERLGYLRPLGAPWPEHGPPPLEPARTVAAAIRARLPGPIGAPAAATVASMLRTL